MRTIVHDLFANTETIEAMTDEALDALKHGEVQQARHVLALLASEIVIAVTNIPSGVLSRSREVSRAADRSGQD